LIPADDQAGHSGLCVAPDGDSNRFISYFGNGRLKTEIVHNDNILRISKFYETGKPKEVVHFRDNRKSGIWKEWYPTGDLKVRGEFRAGRKNGTFSYYHPNGKLHERGVFRDDVRSGVWSTHAKDESLESRVTWLAGTQQGNAEYFFATGSLSEHGGFLAGKKHGRWVGYHPNGNRRYSGAYHSGKKNGEWVEFTMNGQVGSRKGFAKGVEVPRTHLAGTVPFSRGDVLGARTPQSLQGRYGAHAPRKAPKPKAVKKKDSGWVSM
jgi:antitoxin component YwqK of YwqJK toxin-antitoxin module